MTILEKKQEIMSAYADYKRWLAQGRLPYLDKQYYYDDYHRGVYPINSDDHTYEASIQLRDSPSGDCWWYPKFRMTNGDTDCEILSEACERY